MLVIRKQLKDMGFIEITKNLFLKQIGQNRLFRDYRNEEPKSYAYNGTIRVPNYLFKEFNAIEIIEKKLNGKTNK